MFFSEKVQFFQKGKLQESPFSDPEAFPCFCLMFLSYVSVLCFCLILIYFVTVTVYSAYSVSDKDALIVAEPAATAVTVPFSSTVTTASSLDV